MLVWLLQEVKDSKDIVQRSTETDFHKIIDQLRCLYVFDEHDPVFLEQIKQVKNERNFTSFYIQYI